MSDSQYPRDHKTLRRECTRDPIFLFQERVPVWYPDGSLTATYDYEAEGFVDENGADLTTEEAIERGAGTWVWRTCGVFLTREEGEDWGNARSYNYPDGFRVYCIPAEGALCEVLATATEGGRYR